MDELPISKIRVTVRPPLGADELLLLERGGQGKRAALLLIARLASVPEGESYNWGNLTVMDFQALLLLLRRVAFGEMVRSQTACDAGGCGARVEICFRISDYLAHQNPRRPADVELAEEPGWFLIKTLGATFRLPTVADVIAAGEGAAPITALNPSAREILTLRLMKPSNLPATAIRRVEAAMAVMAPDFRGKLHGTCPDCGRKILVYFDVEQFVLREFRDQAAFIYQDVHLLASRYQWAEHTILELPRNRRILYAEMLKQEGGLV
jgi:hypothetical protein